MLDGRAEDCVGEAGEGAGGVVLAVAERLGIGFDLVDCLALSRGILGFEGAAGVVEAAELDGDAGTNSYQRREGSFVECRGAFVLENLRGAV